MSCTRQKPIVVHASVWKPVKKWFRIAGTTHRVKYVHQARDILDKHGRTLTVKFQ